MAAPLAKVITPTRRGNSARGRPLSLAPEQKRLLHSADRANCSQGDQQGACTTGFQRLTTVRFTAWRVTVNLPRAPHAGRPEGENESVGSQSRKHFARTDAPS